MKSLLWLHLFIRRLLKGSVVPGIEGSELQKILDGLRPPTLAEFIRILAAVGKELPVNDEGIDYRLMAVSGGERSRPRYRIFLQKKKQPLRGMEDLRDEQQGAVMVLVDQFRIQNREERLGGYAPTPEEPEMQPLLPGDWGRPDETRNSKVTEFPGPKK